MFVPDSYRFPIPRLGSMWPRYSALDVAEQIIRDRTPPHGHLTPRYMLRGKHEEREQRAIIHTYALKRLHNVLDKVLSE